MQEKENVIRILEETLVALKNEDVIALRELSNQTTHTSSVQQDPENIAVAVIVYSLGKIVERSKNGDKKICEELCKKISDLIRKVLDSLEHEKYAEASKYLNSITNEINKSPADLKGYIQDVFRKASINKASKIYEHGISMERTASLLGISMFELASYSGQKPDTLETASEKTISVKDRIKTAMEMFE